MKKRSGIQCVILVLTTMAIDTFKCVLRFWNLYRSISIFPAYSQMYFPQLLPGPLSGIREELYVIQSPMNPAIEINHIRQPSHSKKI